MAALFVVGAIVLKGNPIFAQPRPGRDEKVFYLYKFRTMTNATFADGKPLPDGERLNGYGRFMRSSSLDELPSLVNILKGDLAIVGPRPQLVRDMVFMTPEQRRRHTVAPGLTGLAQANGRNAIGWEKKLELDLQYIDAGITFWNDFKIVLLTAFKVVKREGITEEGMETAADYGDYLSAVGRVTPEEYAEKQAEATRILNAGDQDRKVR